MAKRRRTQTTIVRAAPVFSRQPAPIIRVQSSTPRAPKQRRRRSRGHSGGRSGSTKSLMNVAIGGALLGFIQKTFPSFPTLPIIGQAGTIALAAHFLGKGHPMLQDVAHAGAAVAGYQLGHDGKIAGDIDGMIASQV
jgi:hypothetical protein